MIPVPWSASFPARLSFSMANNGSFLLKYTTYDICCTRNYISLFILFPIIKLKFENPSNGNAAADQRKERGIL